MPDANKEATLSALTGAAFGAAGQRCMAITAAVFVGGMGPWKEGLIAAAKALKVRCQVLASCGIRALGLCKAGCGSGRRAPSAPPRPSRHAEAGLKKLRYEGFTAAWAPGRSASSRP